jgi:L-ascorbate 6-phosphate lactonase
MSANPRTILLASDTSYKICLKSGIPQKQLQLFNRGSKADLGGYHVEAVFADHGDHAPDAIGMIVETEGYRIYFSGDTSFQCKRMAYAASKNIDILVLPINGEYGNMNSNDAVDFVKLVKPKITIPSHFWMFIRHGSNPYAFALQMEHEAPAYPFYFMCQGEEVRWNGSLERID